MDKDAAFPVDWNDWRTEWKTWREEHSADLKPSSWRFPPKNFMADDVIGVFSISGRNVELSEVTFPDLSKQGSIGSGNRVRYVGVTSDTGAGTENGGLASTFAELERALGLTDRAEDEETTSDG